MDELYYCGIGSRATPDDILEKMKKIGSTLAKIGFILRSGAADGADSAYEEGCDEAGGQKEIFLPWKGFNASSSPFYEYPGLAEEIAFQFHPNLYAQKDAVVKLMARNTQQVLGQDCKTRSKFSKFVICYCPVDKNGKWLGGTGQALRIAEAKKIPIYNLFIEGDLDRLKVFIKALQQSEQNNQ